MSYSAIAGYLIPGHPARSDTESTVGSTYVYRGPTATLETNRPAVGDLWADGRTVSSARIFEFNTVSGISELVVVTATNVTYSGTIGSPSVEQTSYGLRWRPIVKPLEVHPDFQTGGTYALDATARRCIIGWRAELDSSLKTQYKFRQLNSNGTPGAIVDIAAVSANAKVFIELAEKGIEEYVDYMPVWRKRSIYKGSSAPDGGSIGQAGAVSGPLPSAIANAYHFVKSNDEVERIGSSYRWRRDEEWEGSKQVFADRDDIFTDGNPY
jgi:hypothetical protein